MWEENLNIQCPIHKEMPFSLFCSKKQCQKNLYCSDCLLEDPAHQKNHANYLINPKDFFKRIQIQLENNLSNINNEKSIDFGEKFQNDIKQEISNNVNTLLNEFEKQINQLKETLTIKLMQYIEYHPYQLQTLFKNKIEVESLLKRNNEDLLKVMREIDQSIEEMPLNPKFLNFQQIQQNFKEITLEVKKDVENIKNRISLLIKAEGNELNKTISSIMKNEFKDIITFSSDNCIRRLNVSNFEQTAFMRLNNTNISACTSIKNQNIFAIGTNDGFVKLIDIDSNKIVLSKCVLNTRINQIIYLDSVFSLAVGDISGFIHVLKLPLLKEEEIINNKMGNLNSLIWLNQQQMLVSANNSNEIQFYNFEQKEIVKNLKFDLKNIRKMVYCEQKKQIFCSVFDENLILINISDFSYEEKQFPEIQINYFEINDQADLLFISDQNKFELLICSLNSFEIKFKLDHQNQSKICCLYYLTDQNQLFAGDEEGNIFLYDLDSQGEVYQNNFHNGRVLAILS